MTKKSRFILLTPALFILIVVLFMLAPVPGMAQVEAPATGGDEVAVDPIRCWWKTDRPAVHFGERFVLTLSCRVVETATATVAPSLTALEPGAVLLTPFESVGGRRYDDVVAPPYRYLQFDYDVRFLGEGAFGTDVEIPPLTVPYAVQVAAGGGAAPGREQQYVLPAIPLRVVSLAPQGATDIRDASRDTFGAIEAHRFRATAARLGTGLFAGLALVLVAVGVARAAAGRRRVRGAAVVRPVPAPLVLQACLGTLRQVRADAARDGWTPAHARRAATVFRIAGAAAMGRPVAQVIPTGRQTADEGQVIVRRGIRRRPVLLSAPTTPESMARFLAAEEPSAGERAAIEPMHEALRACSAYAYGRPETLDEATLDRALDEGATAVRRLQARRLWSRGTRSEDPAAHGLPVVRAGL